MADIEQTTVNVEMITKTLEQKFAANIAKTGVAPSLAAAPFTPHHSEDDGILRYKESGTPANDEADAGGLFTLDHQQPAVLEWVMMDLGASVAYTISIVTTAGAWEVASGTDRYVVVKPTAPLMPGEAVKIVAAAPGAVKSWVRVYVRLDQARR
jgi:hypothetical protein